MRAMFDALLAAATPTEAAADLYAVVLDGAAGDAAVRRAVTLLAADHVLDARSAPSGSAAQAIRQPADRGSLPAALAALVDLLPRDPEAIVLITGTAVAPADLLAAVENVVIEPEGIVTFRTRPGPPTFAGGLAVVAEARVLLRLALAGAPEWAEAMCDTAFDPLQRDDVYRTLPSAALEPLLRTPGRAPSGGLDKGSAEGVELA
jgi:hypothetical protein